MIARQLPISEENGEIILSERDRPSGASPFPSRRSVRHDLRYERRKRTKGKHSQIGGIKNEDNRPCECFFLD